MLERPDSYRRWESEHAQMMRTVSDQARLDNQVTALRSTAFALVHRRALFEYLRKRQLTGIKRRQAFALFYGCRDYANAVLAEHGRYVRCSSSYVCTRYLGENLLHDQAFDEPLALYEQRYSEYFEAYCDVELARDAEEHDAVQPLEALRPLLKLRVSEARTAILTMPQHSEESWREIQIRKPNGDTQRLRSIFGPN
ncbi:MAG TPA: hypothetical protein VFK87_02740 [Steroidobacteraceae bacterium]|nr:hypothetical protein [Steroidobacteraceae bacterium]